MKTTVLEKAFKVIQEGLDGFDKQTIKSIDKLLENPTANNEAEADSLEDRVLDLRAGLDNLKHALLGRAK